MTKRLSTSMYSAVLLSFLLAVVVGSPTEPARNIPDPLKKMQPVGAIPASEADLLSREEPDGVTVVKGNHVRSGKKVSRRSYAALFKPQVDKFLQQVPVARHFPGHFAKHMSCGNESSGCGLLFPDEEAANYSPQQHLSKFFLCLATVVCRDECTLKCTALVDNSPPEKPLVPAEKENEQLVKLEKNVTGQIGALDLKLAKLIGEFDSQKNKLVEIGHQLDHLNDALQEKMRAATASTLESVDSKAREVKALLNEKTESMTTTISSGLSMVVINPKTHRWTLTGYAGLKAEAIKDHWCRRLSEPVYIEHYLISWGIHFHAVDGNVSLFLSFMLKKGINDEFLDWPFSNKLKLCLIHPETQQEHCAVYKTNLAAMYNKYFARPLEDSIDPLGLVEAKFDTSYCEKNGFIKEDKLLLKLEVLS